MSNEYDISRAFKRIENDLIDSMMRNMKRHRVEEAELGIEWEQWQALQLQELERFRAENAQLFGDDFQEINEKIDDMFWATYNDAQGAEEHRLMDRIKKGDFTPPIDKGSFFNLNEGKLQALLMATKADFARAEYAMLRRANDQYRKIIFDAMTYANVTNDYNKAVDMATKDFLRSGINCIVYRNGARHTVPDYARMALRTGNKRAYLMGEGNAHDRYGLHTVRVNKRPHACPKCVGFLGRLLIDDVYGGGSRAEATAMGIPTLSDAIGAGFLHPNCKDMYSVYIPEVSKPATPWTQEEISDIVGEYNQEQEIRHAEDMRDTYQRMAKYSLDPENQATYQQRADDWQIRLDELSEEPPTPVPEPTPQPIPQTTGFTDEEKEAIEWYVSGDGMWINRYLRGNMEGAVLSDAEKRLSNLLDSATNRTLEYDKLYRSVDASVIFEGLNETEVDQMVSHLMWGNDAYDKGAYSQGIKKRMEQELAKAKGKSLTEKGFMSTTIDEQIAIDFRDFTDARNPVVIELDTKGKKLKGADLTEFDIPEDPQKERLLARNTRYKINDIGVDTDADGVKYIKVKAEILDQGAEAVEEVVETVAEPPKVEPFVPAKTKAEAEQFAKKFAENANYSGVSLANANIINEQLNVLTSKYPINKLNEISTGGKGVMNANYHRLGINGKKLGKVLNDEAVNFELNKAMNKSSIKMLKDRWAGKKMPFAIESDIKKLEDKIKFERWGVHSMYEDHVKCVVTHEYGHILSDQYFGMINAERANPNYAYSAPGNDRLREMNRRWDDALKKARDTGDIYKISQYANTKPSEFFAECFALREMGGKLPDYVESLMKEVLDNGIM